MIDRSLNVDHDDVVGGTKMYKGPQKPLRETRRRLTQPKASFLGRLPYRVDMRRLKASDPSSLVGKYLFRDLSLPSAE